MKQTTTSFLSRIDRYTLEISGKYWWIALLVFAFVKYQELKARPLQVQWFTTECFLLGAALNFAQVLDIRRALGRRVPGLVRSALVVYSFVLFFQLVLAVATTLASRAHSAEVTVGMAVVLVIAPIMAFAELRWKLLRRSFDQSLQNGKYEVARALTLGMEAYYDFPAPNRYRRFVIAQLSIGLLAEQVGDLDRAAGAYQFSYALSKAKKLRKHAVLAACGLARVYRWDKPDAANYFANDALQAALPGYRQDLLEEVLGSVGDLVPALRATRANDGRLSVERILQKRATPLLRDSATLDVPAATAAVQLARYHAQSNRYAEAISLLDRIEAKSAKHSHLPIVSDARQLLSALMVVTGELDAGINLLKMEAIRVSSILTRLADGATERELLQVSKTTSAILSQFAFAICQRKQRRADEVRCAAELSINFKAIAQHVRAFSHRLYGTQLADGHDAIAIELKDLKERASRAWREPRDHSDLLDRIDYTERLLLSLRGDRLADSFISRTLKDVAGALNESEAFVDILLATPGRLPGTDAKDVYIALVSAASGQVELVEFGEAESTDRVIEGGLKLLAWEVDIAGSELPSALALRTGIAIPLCRAASGIRRLSISSDGRFNLLPFSALPIDENSYLLDLYEIRYVASGRELVAKRSPADFTEPVVIASPSFTFNAAPNEGKPDKSTARPDNQVGPARSGVALFAPLEGALEEGQCVSELLGVPLWSGSSATEHRFRCLRSPLLLHVATHAFFLEHVDGVSQSISERSARLDRLAADDNPMIRAGIALAGVNDVLQGRSMPEEVGDGILNALDVSMLNLQETELVVLSACDTGIGTVQAGEGVLGLRRAFQIAGAANVVVSSWKVSDHVTARLMGAFYRALAEKMTVGSALRHAQLSLRQTMTSPYSWGAFSAHGAGDSVIDLNRSAYELRR